VEKPAQNKVSVSFEISIQVRRVYNYDMGTNLHYHICWNINPSWAYDMGIWACDLYFR